MTVRNMKILLYFAMTGKRLTSEDISLGRYWITLNGWMVTQSDSALTTSTTKMVVKDTPRALLCGFAAS